MANATENEDKKKSKPLSLSKPGKLELKKTVEGGQVRQSFSHGRTKTVTVEVKRKRTFRQGAAGEMTEIKDSPQDEVFETTSEAASVEAPVAAPAPKTGRTLTEAEKASRTRALDEARKAAEEAARESATAQIALEEARRAGEAEEAAAKAEEEALAKAKEAEEAVANVAAVEDAQKKEAKAAEAAAAVEEAHAPETRTRREIEEEARRAAEAEAQRMADEASQRAADAERKRAALEVEVKGDVNDDEETTPDRRKVRGGGAVAAEAPARPTNRTRGDRKRRSGKLTISEALNDEGGARQRSVAAFRRKQERERQQRSRDAGGGGSSAKVVREVSVPDTITVGELANRMAERANEVVKALMKMGVMATTNQTIDQETAQLVVEEFGHSPKLISASDVELNLGASIEDDAGLRLPRPPVVTVMGHVDHGKTSLLDALRSTDVVRGEAGGITQHIGAYQVVLETGEKISFIDTPGHAAFTSMRQRGAHVTDIVILVVAADDGVQPQTIEAINHARAAEVPIIVAVNKMDLPAADSKRIKTELLSHEIVAEEMGGDVQVIEISATTRMGLDTLTEAISLQAEVLELTANPERAAFGAVIEAQLEAGRGAVATVLVQGGSLNVGDIFVAGAEWGRVRALINERGENIKSAGPSEPVEVLGLNGAPQAGDDFAVVNSDARAREVVEYRQDVIRDKRVVAGARGSLDEMFEQIKAGEAAQVPVVIKGDVQGSVEAIVSSLNNMSTDEVEVLVLHAGVGGITESDVSLASVNNGLLIGFNVRAISQARDQAKRDQVEIRYYNVIYNVVDDIRAMLEGELAPTIQENLLGSAEIREVFSVSKVGKVAGCMVTEGLIRRDSKIRLTRDSVVIHEGQLGTLRRFKDDVREVQNNYECGIALENYNDIQVGDIVDCFEVQEIARRLEA
ncbi:MAG: translation initiation factor IF-2 [Alphaproteobacteria bacterium]|nr:translation initiation factor IF-2 [Alphaproteobacteria bacterium]